MSHWAFGLLCGLPFALLFGLRGLLLKERMDRKARRDFRRRASLFVLASVAASALLHAGAGRWPLPLAWLLIAVLPVPMWLGRVLRRI